MSAVLPELVAKVDASFRQGALKEAQAAQATLNKWSADPVLTCSQAC